ncbi:hypothetical protein [Bradyrhizobium elkanii]|uniref:hypothetical protein n=1 Tax=Bradyrhizobium elkanii TaxID=29448 RepID=UPI003D21B0DE
MSDTKHSEIEILSYSLFSSADWRREKAKQFPRDAERNLAAAELLDKLSSEATDLIGSDLDRELTTATSTMSGAEIAEWNDRRSEFIRDVGFDWRPSASDLAWKLISKCWIVRKRCSICFGPLGRHMGNNADPVNNGRCCDDCDRTVVIPARFRAITAAKSEVA